jgi:MFS family permease
MRLGAFRHRDFRLFWIGQLVSLVGTWMQSVGQSWLVLELTHSPLSLGVVNALQFAPVLLLSPVGGAISDRTSKRNILLITQAVMMIQALVLALLVRHGHVRYWHVALLAAIYGLGRAVDIPARQAFITDLVGRQDLANAVALNSMVFNGRAHRGSERGGPPDRALRRGGGVLPERALFRRGAGGAARHAHAGRPGPRGPARPAARLLDASQLCDGHAGGGLHPLAAGGGEPARAQLQHRGAADRARRAARGRAGLRLSHVRAGGGAVVGAAGLALGRKDRPPLAFLSGSAAVLCAGVATLGLVAHFPTAMVALAVLGMLQIYFTTSANTSLQLITPQALRGRVMGLYAMAFAGVTPFGSLLVGTLAEHWGVRVACAIGGSVGALAVISIAVLSRSRLSPSIPPTPPGPAVPPAPTV